MDEKKVDNTIRLAEHLAFTKSFKPLFTEGMMLVEEAAGFLDGEGRIKARGLSKPASVLYASESMRLTTRLMQLASWLLLQPSANEGEMSRDQMLSEKKKIRLDQLSTTMNGPGWDELPQSFVELVRRSIELQVRIRMLDREIYGERMEMPKAQGNPVGAQLDLLSTAFGGRR